jgi:hypothetical protein
MPKLMIWPTKYLVVAQLLNKSPIFNEIQGFIIVFTSARRRSLIWGDWIQFTAYESFPSRFILFLFSHLRLGLPVDLITSGFPKKIL